MFAKFNTADFLIVIDRINDISVEKSEPIYFDMKYQSKAIKRVVKLKINVRILDKKGQILWIKDISGKASDLILPEFISIYGSPQNHIRNLKKNTSIF